VYGLSHYVIPHFSAFLNDISLSSSDRKDADGKAERIAKSLFAYYYPACSVFEPTCYVKVGSYGKGTACSACTDLDMLFVLPWSVYTRIEALQGNKQSQLLREVKDALFWTFPKTDLKANGQIVDVPFSTYKFEVVPVFRMDDGSFLTPHTANDGSWRSTNPFAEYQSLHNIDLAWNMKATHLTQMLKAWKYECNVPVKSLSLEVLASEFVKQWQYREQTIFYYDWMIRDFFEFMLRYVNGWTRVIGTEEIIQLGCAWESRCRTAYAHALKACEHEKLDWAFSSTSEWQAIFGNAFSGTNLAKAMALA